MITLKEKIKNLREKERKSKGNEAVSAQHSHSPDLVPVRIKLLLFFATFAHSFWQTNTCSCIFYV